MDNPKNWYVLYTKSRVEKRVYDELKEIGLDAYLPMRKTLKLWSDRKKWVYIPVINSYVFVYIPQSDYSRVFDVKGVVAYVSANKKAVVVPEHEMKAMQQAVNSNLSFNVEADAVQKGQTITITTGPLKGITGEVVEIQGAKKFYLRISHIGYMLVIDLNEDDANKSE